MKYIKILLFTLFLSLSFSSNAQKVKFKKGYVIIDDSQCFKYEGGALADMVTIYDLEDNEIFSYEYNKGTFGDSYYDVYFNEQDIRVKLKVDSAARKDFIKKMIKSKAIQDCRLDSKKLESFINKYSL